MNPLAPTRTTDLLVARGLLQSDGAVIVSGRGGSSEAVVTLGHELFGDSVREMPSPAEVREGGVGDRRPSSLDNTTPLPAHTDGFAYGELYPDVIMLGCAESSAQGGESFLVDGYALLEHLVSTPEGSALVEQLMTVSIDQTEPSMHRSITPVIGKTSEGRLMLRRFPFQRPATESTTPDADQRMIEAWWSAVLEVAAQAPRFRLEQGDALVIDNYRVLHGREPYSDLNRQLWRLWIWTVSAFGVPEGRLHSDSRYAAIP